MRTLGPDQYYSAALDILSEEGPEALTIASLCGRLSISKGSFYHHFSGMGGFTDDLLAAWENAHGDVLSSLATDEPEPLKRIPILVELAVGLPHSAEAAIRAWGRSNASVAAAVERMDLRREKAVIELGVALGAQRREAVVHARMALSILVGVQQREKPVNGRQLRAMYALLTRPVFERALVG